MSSHHLDTAVYHESTRIANANLQLLIDKLNVERHERGVEPIPSVEELRAEETQNNATVFAFVKTHIIHVLNVDNGLTTLVGDEAVNKTIDDSTKAIIKFFEEQS